ncbi:MAG: hypothetical protein IIC71_09930 [Acidobacteria bacterium]|nr:hypothetical protein [Acidobacteriota bacterium]
MDLGVQEVEHALRSLGALLASRRQHLDVAIVGGSALLLMGYSSRATQDVDVVGTVVDGEVVRTRELPEPVRVAVTEVGAALGLGPTWLNLGPASLVDLGLPSGFTERAAVRRFDTLTILIADRIDQIHFKLYAAADSGPHSKHFADLQVLGPSGEELMRAAAWCATHDPSPDFTHELDAVIATLGGTDDE